MIGPRPLPPAYVGTLFGALLGGLVPGIYMTLVSAPGNSGSPVYGLILPWTILPFLLSVAAGWRARADLPVAGSIRNRTVAAAALGAIGYTYLLLVHPNGARQVAVFLWLPLVQWGLLARALARAWRAARPGPDEAGES